MQSGYEKAKDVKFFNGEFEWKKFGDNEIDQAVEHMRSIHRENQEGNLKINQHGVKTGIKYSWNNTAKTIGTALFSG